jgi:uncharacterized membrane protein
VTALPLILTVFVACAVEATEALTIVLAAGLTREWRSAFQGMAAALVVLAVVTAVLGPALTVIPLAALRLVVGALLAIFGIQWLRKAILRATGYKSLHDEASAYLREVAAAKAAATESRRGVRDWYAFTLSFKGVLLEGLEVVFIVITFGANQRNVGAAVIGAAAAIVVVAVTGIAVRAPLARLPENAMKFVVGIMLTSFGLFWGAEGAGVSWPGHDAALLVLVPVVALISLGYTALYRQPRPPQAAAAAQPPESEPEPESEEVASS